MNRQVLLLAAVLSIILVLACAGCSELPVDGRVIGSEGGDGAAATPTATPNWVQVATPIRTQEPTVTASPTETPSQIEVPGYAEIYSNKVYLLYDVMALNYDLKVPAMIIDLDIHPDMYTNTKRIYSDFGTKDLITIKEFYPDPHADLIITIIDRDTGDVVEENDFAQFTKENERHTITLRYPGNYQLEITGNNVEVGITISVPEANLVDNDNPFS
ncbi:DUF3244 domain-containing protein [Methanogenium marinum]|uniref:DUF3244 domain-containing protein n=1 Tax=Methanogenium marinum TaxID=348610 RepID=A0A9Q4PXM7_9EURY|nr:hypothetical protein [Methanogenium marinum]MDE4907273.1 DUF3244 domain-containing protein [Methanogenium marinum]